MKTQKDFVDQALKVANDLAQKTQGTQLFEEELIAAWGLNLFHDIRDEAKLIRLTTWQMAKAEDANVKEIDLEPPTDLILAVAVRKLLKVSLYNRGDFPQTIEE